MSPLQEKEEHREKEIENVSCHDQLAHALALAHVLYPYLYSFVPSGGHSLGRHDSGHPGACPAPCPFRDGYPVLYPYPYRVAFPSPYHAHGGYPALAPLPDDGAWSATGSLRESYDATYGVCSLEKASVSTLPSRLDLCVVGK